MPKYFTVVYEVHDEDKFRQIASEAASGMLSPPERIARLGYDITGCGWGDSMTKADALEQLAEAEGLDMKAGLHDMLGDEFEEESAEQISERVKAILG